MHGASNSGRSYAHAPKPHRERVSSRRSSFLTIKNRKCSVLQNWSHVQLSLALQPQQGRLHFGKQRLSHHPIRSSYSNTRRDTLQFRYFHLHPPKLFCALPDESGIEGRCPFSARDTEAVMHARKSISMSIPNRCN